MLQVGTASIAHGAQRVPPILNAETLAGRGLPNLKLTDNGLQHGSREFRSSMTVLGITLEYVYIHTLEQNDHIEPFHKALKKEYVWPREFAGIQEADESMHAAFEDYNHHKIHSVLRYLTPFEFAGPYRQGPEGAIHDIVGEDKRE